MKFNMVKASEFCDSVRDGTHDSPKRVNKGYKLITSKHIKEYGLDLENAYYISEKDFNKINERSLVEKNDILYSMIGTVGLIHRIDYEPNYAIKNIGLFKLKDEIKSKWLYYYLKSPKMKSYINSLLSGSTQQYITLNSLRNLPIAIPENYIDMIKIIKILELLEKKININAQTNNNLYEIGLSLIEEEYNSINKTEKLQNIIQFTKGKKPVKIVKYKDKNFDKYLTIACLNYQELNYANKEKMILAQNDILMVMDGASSGEVYYSDCGIVGSTFARIDIINKIFTKEYMFFILKKYTDLIKTKNTGSAIPHVDKAFINLLSVPILSIENQKKYCIILKKIQQNEHKIRNLMIIRDTLLPKLMNGEIDIDKIEI